MKVFISYRRDDSQVESQFIQMELVREIGEENVFFDVDDIPYGVNFKTYLADMVAECGVMLVMMGKGWADSQDERGERRLTDPRDFVRIEIESAFARDLKIIPVLLNGARMPGPDDLPESLQRLSYLNAAEIRWGRDLNTHRDRLFRAIKNIRANAEWMAAAQSDDPASPMVVLEPEDSDFGTVRSDDSEMGLGSNAMPTGRSLETGARGDTQLSPPPAPIIVRMNESGRDTPDEGGGAQPAPDHGLQRGAGRATVRAPCSTMYLGDPDSSASDEAGEPQPTPDVQGLERGTGRDTLRIAESVDVGPQEADTVDGPPVEEAAAEEAVPAEEAATAEAAPARVTWSRHSLTTASVAAVAEEEQFEVEPTTYRVSTRSEDEVIDGRIEAVTKAREISVETGQSVLVERTDGRVKMTFRDGSLVDHVLEGSDSSTADGVAMEVDDVETEADESLALPPLNPPIEVGSGSDTASEDDRSLHPLVLGGILLALVTAVIWFMADGAGVHPDGDDASTLMTRCEAGDGEACRQAGLQYQKGHDGRAPEPGMAMTFFKKACDADNADGCMRYGYGMKHGVGVKKDVKLAVTYDTLACERGNATGCFNLGWTYKTARGVKADMDRANALFKKACDAGEMMGCNSLGVSYAQGLGALKKDIAKASLLYLQACEGALGKACDNLGFLYEHGKAGLPKNCGEDKLCAPREALHLYREACRFKYQRGCKNRDRMQGVIGLPGAER